MKLPEAVTKLEFIEGYRFRTKFDEESMPDIFVDEERPVGNASGPNPARLLSAAVGHCASSSLLYCLHKARIDVKNIETTVKTDVDRNDQGYLRVKNIDVQIHVEIEEKNKARLGRCLAIFENYCTVTESVRKGIDVDVSIV
jgi:uncharacterized OsmC-like protein